MPLDDTADVLTTLVLVGQLGFIMVGAILAGFLVGNFLDEQFGTGPVFTIVLLLSGIGGGMVAVYRLVMHTLTGNGAERNTDEESKN